LTIIRDAIDAVQHNLRAFFIYLAFILPVGLANLLWDLLEFKELLTGMAPATTNLCAVGIQLAGAAVASLGCSVAFSMMGRDIDHPMWRISGSGEAIRRYFGLWFLLVLVDVVLVQALQLAHDLWPMGGAAGIVSLMRMAINAAIIPVGASIMFLGRPHFGNLGEAIAPLFRQFPKSLVLMALGVFILSLFHVVLGVLLLTEPAPSIPMIMAAGAVLSVIGAYFDCVVFAGAWIICMIDRDTTEEQDIGF
jgi:hypothetical protein